MRPFDAILFDLGGTLIYFDGQWPEIAKQADAEMLRQLQAAGLNLDAQAFLSQFNAQLGVYYTERDTEFIEYTTHYILCTLLAEFGYPELPDSVLRPALEARYAVSRTHWHPEVDAQPTLELLRNLGYRFGIISNAGDDTDVQTLVDKAQLRLYLDFVLTSAALGVRKPNPRIFLAALDHWGIPPVRAAMVGDTLGADILGAINAGIFSIWITRRAEKTANRSHEDTIHPDATITALSELPGLLKSLTQFS
jgi:FMN phosphatase YigB (HAD superfamily)